tara:strand:- start:1584 stop:2078 length:495 start_codon:yes stop_codon:yes gene_type:complete
MNLKFIGNKRLIDFFYIFLIFALDRISKILVLSLSEKYSEIELYQSSFVNIFLIWNKGIAFGLLSFEKNDLYNLITVLIFVIILILFVLVFKSERFKKISYIFITGGALGNLFDRIVYNSVPDFIDIHYKEFHWFIFNIADIFITIGVICLIFDEIILERKRYD